jgi:hypothetical protein
MSPVGFCRSSRFEEKSDLFHKWAGRRAFFAIPAEREDIRDLGDRQYLFLDLATSEAHSGRSGRPTPPGVRIPAMEVQRPTKVFLRICEILIVVGIAVAAYSAATTESVHEETLEGVGSSPKEWGGIFTGLGIAAVGFIGYGLFRVRSKGPRIPLQVVGPDGTTVNTTLEELATPENFARMEAAQHSVILSKGADGWGTVIQAVPTPQKSPTGLPLHFLRLEVHVQDGRPPFEAMSNYEVPPEKAAAVNVGARLPVKVLSNDASGVAIDWESF